MEPYNKFLRSLTFIDKEKISPPKTIIDLYELWTRTYDFIVDHRINDILCNKDIDNFKYFQTTPKLLDVRMHIDKQLMKLLALIVEE